MKYPIKLMSSDSGELIGQVIDIFEDFLEARHISLPNPEKTYSEDPAVIYGTDYGALKCELEDMFLNWGILQEVQ